MATDPPPPPSPPHPAPRGGRHRPLLLRSAAGAAFALSGASGLILELVWSRQLAGVFGCSATAITAVLTAFMAGLALGALIGGRVAPKLRAPLAAYGVLEIGIGLTALAVAPALGMLAPLRTWLWRAAQGTPWLLVGDVALAWLLLIVPTTLMGATLPVLGEAARGTSLQRERGAALLYALNTVGAVVGTTAAGLLLLPRLGLSTTTWVAVGCNLVVGAGMLLLARRWIAARDPGADEPVVDAAPTTPPHPEPSLGPFWTPRVALLAAAVGSAAGMAYQVLWSRGLAVVLGSSTYSFTSVLVAYLIGLAAGGAAAVALLPRVRRPLRALGGARLLVALGAAPCLFFLDRLPEVVLGFLRGAQATPGVVIAFTFAVSVAVVLVPTLAMGAAFPLALAATRGGGPLGARLGRLQAAATVGSIVGAGAAGFVLLPGLGLRVGVTVVVVVDLLLALGLALLSLRTAPRRGAWVLAAATALALLVVPATVPRWNKARFTSGLYRVSLVKEIYQDSEYSEPEQLLYRDGVSATVTVERRGEVTILKSNGKVEASSHADMPTQILVALLPILLHPRPSNALLVGLASGVTAGAALQSDIEELTVVELEPAMVEASRFFDAVNHRPLDDPRTRLTLGDGRNVLMHTADRYDVIISEPSNPWIAGVSALFTREAFAAARARLRPGGIFCQWLQLYEISPDNVRTVLRTFRAEFPHVLVFSSMEKGVDLLLVGAQEPLRLSLTQTRRRLAGARTRAEAKRGGVHDPFDLFALLFLGPGELERFAGAGPLTTDDHDLLEFSAPLDLIGYAEHEDFFRGVYHGGQGYGQVAPLVSDLSPGDRLLLSAALLRRGKLREASSLAAADATSPAQAARLQALVGLAEEPLKSAGRARLPVTLAGVPRHRMARLSNLLERGLARDALDLLALLPAQVGRDPAYANLAAYAFLLDGLSSSAIEVLNPVATGQPAPLLGYLMGRALLQQQRYREGFRWLQWSLAAGLEGAPAAPGTPDLPETPIDVRQ